MHGHEYRARKDDVQPPELSLEELRRQVRRLKADKGFDITPEQRLAYLTSEVGEVAREVRAVRERLGTEIYDALWNLLDPAELAGVDLDGAFAKKARQNIDREW